MIAFRYYAMHRFEGVTLISDLAGYSVPRDVTFHFRRHFDREEAQVYSKFLNCIKRQIPTRKR